MKRVPPSFSGLIRLTLFGASCALLFQLRLSAQQQIDLSLPLERVSIAATETQQSLGAWSAVVSEAARTGSLRLQSADRDPMLPTHIVERFDQFHHGVRIWGANIVRDTERGVPHVIF